MTVQPDSSDPEDDDSISPDGRLSRRSESNRREFLKGKSAVDALRDEAEFAVPIHGQPQLPGRVPTNQRNRQSAYFEQYSKNAMACEFELLFNLHQYPQSGAAAMAAFQLIDEIEDQMTVYRDHSEVSRLNQAAFGSAVVIESHLFELLSLAKKIHDETAKAFDITSNPLTKIWGFDQRKGGLPVQDQIDEALSRVGSELVELDVETKSVRFQRNGVTINLGGIGKGHALDRVAKLFEDRSIGDYAIHGGQSSVLARGSSVCHPDTKPLKSSEQESIGDPELENSGWAIGISHPTLPGVRLAEVNLHDQALGTSGTGRQGFFYQGKRFGHIIDPRTGWPTSHFLSTTVISHSAAISDALATAFFVMPMEAIVDYCDSHPSVSAILVKEGPKKMSPVELIVLNLADSDWQRLA